MFCPVNKTNKTTIRTWVVKIQVTANSVLIQKKSLFNFTYEWALTQQGIFEFLHFRPFWQFVQNSRL